MKKSLLALVTTLTLAGCANTPTAGASSTTGIAQVAAQVCPIATAVLTDLNSPLAPLTPSELAAVAVATPPITTACQLGASINLTSYQGLQQAIQTLITTLGASANLSPQARRNLFLLQVAISAATAAQASAVVTPPAP